MAFRIRLILSLVVLGLAAFPPAFAAAPRAVAVEPVIDVGGVSQGEEIVHSFAIRNDGDGPLEIAQVKPSCGCTVAEYDEVIAPGASGSVRVVLKTKEFNGPIAKSVRVYTNDAENIQINLVIKANIQVQITADPAYSRYIVVSGAGGQTNRHLVFSEGFSDLEIVDAKSPFPFLDVAYRPAGDDERRSSASGKQWIVDLTLEPDAPVGPLANYVELRTNHPRQEVVKVAVSGFVRPIIGVTPSTADFGSRRLAAPYRSSFDVRNYTDGDIEVTAAEIDVAGIETSIKELTEGKRYEVLLTLTPSMTAGPFEGTLRLSTTSTAQPVVEVPLKGEVL